jgi:hypothetical protein
MSSLRVLILLGTVLAINAFHGLSIPSTNGLGLRRCSGLVQVPSLRSANAPKTIRRMSDEPIFEEEEPPKPKAKQVRSSRIVTVVIHVQHGLLRGFAGYRAG